MNDLIEVLQRWYISQCDGDWEHAYGISIAAIHSSEWRVLINGIFDKKPISIEYKRAKVDWIHVKATESEFDGHGGIGNLREILILAFDWLQLNQDNSNKEVDVQTSNLIEDLQKWHTYSVMIGNIDNPGWKLEINKVSAKKPVNITIDRDEEGFDWIRVTATEYEFIGYGGAANLKEMLTLAFDWLQNV